MSDSQEHQTTGADNSQTIRIELPIGILGGMRRMMSDLMRTGMSESECCGQAGGRRGPDSDKEGHCEFTVTVGRKE
jgi:hypothetical protein